LLIEDGDVNDEVINEELSDKDEFLVQEEPILLFGTKRFHDCIPVCWNVFLKYLLHS
jgi:hypothetical protein